MLFRFRLKYNNFQVGFIVDTLFFILVFIFDIDVYKNKPDKNKMKQKNKKTMLKNSEKCVNDFFVRQIDVRKFKNSTEFDYIHT